MKAALLAALPGLVVAGGGGSKGVWPASAYASAKAMLGQMTLDEKLAMVHGYGGKYVGDVPANTRLNIPQLDLEDGPQGVADGVTGVTAWPSALTVVQSWDPQLMYAWGRAMAQEQYAKGTNVMLGPAVNLARIPWGGRTFEYQGEDPLLASKMVYAEVMGIQSMPVLGCIKHFSHNNQEYDRSGVSANVPLRATMELYHQAFAAAVDAGVGSAMCSYNRVNNTWACENSATLGWLKGEAGFDGWMMSDWGATHSTVPAALAGLDQQMPDAGYFGAPLAAAVQAGTVPETRIDDMVMRMLTPMYAYGLFEFPPIYNTSSPATFEGHAALARTLAEQATTLLKNDGGLLPLNTQGVKSIGILGDQTTVTGGGSGGVKTPYVVTPLQGLQNYLSPLGESIQLSYYNGSVDGAGAFAASVDVAIVVVATTSHEGADRANLSLPVEHDALVEAVAAANKKTVVVARCPGACVMPWAASVPTILFSLMPGQEAGNALASVLFGDVNPSGKLPVSFPVSMNDTWLSVTPGGPINPLQYPGTIRSNSWLEADYSEELLIGYRWFDSPGSPAPAWPFGHGLSYTSFGYADIRVNGAVAVGAGTTAVVTATLTNTGSVAGAEVAQLYVSFPAAANEPPKVLKAFSKVPLAPGASSTLAFTLGAADLRIWDNTVGWTVVPGTYTLQLGSSSRDIRLTAALTVAA